jgi:hypothetical protein
MKISFTKKYVNIKNKKIYVVCDYICINTTNDNDGQTMVLYTNGQTLFVRERKEFDEKFKGLKEEKNV